MKIFLYGTLRYGGSANYMMRGCTLLCSDSVKGLLYDLGHFPGLKLSGDGIVLGDTYQCPLESSEELIQRLDQYEGYHPTKPDQSLYTRRRIQTTKGHSAFVYEYKHPVHQDLLVETGDWLHP